jgi:alanine racemase
VLNWIEIDGEAVRHNYRQFCRIAGKGRVAPVLKSNAYGHGLAEVYGALAAESPPWLCTNYVAEAAKLRELGYKGRLLVVGPAVARELPEAEALHAELVIGNQEVLSAWLARPAPCRVHVKIDTGMSRQGFAPAEAAAVAARLAGHKDKVAGVCTHFANVEDVTDHAYASQQLKLFGKARQAFQQAGFAPLYHAASSASALIMDEVRFDLARVGVSLYGVWPSPLTRVSYLQLNDRVIDLKPVLSWRTEVTTVKKVQAGQFIGYGCTYRANRDLRIAVLPIGYYEGFPRLASESPSYVLIRGERCPLVGRICMNMLMVDTTHLPHVEVGDRVTLIGQDGAETLAAAEVAAWAKTIHYELLTRLHPEIPRRLVGSV